MRGVWMLDCRVCDTGSIVYTAYLLIDITEGSSKRARSLLNSHIWEAQILPKCHNIIQRRISCWWDILERKGASNSKTSLLQVLILPNPPNSVNLCVVVPKVRVRRRAAKVEIPS
jgi:hypothetical protein